MRTTGRWRLGAIGLSVAVTVAVCGCGQQVKPGAVSGPTTDTVGTAPAGTGTPSADPSTPNAATTAPIITGATVPPSSSTTFEGPDTTPHISKPTLAGGQVIPCNVGTGIYGPFPPEDAPAKAVTPTAADLGAFAYAFSTFNALSTSVITLKPGTALKAVVPSDGYEWGFATYESALNPEPESLKLALNPPLNSLVFVKPPGCPWSYNGPLASVFPCQRLYDVPVGVASAWGLKEQSNDACNRAFVPPSPR